jgi:hypothetical protein
VTKKKPRAKGRTVPKQWLPRHAEAGPVSAAAAMIMGCKGGRGSLPVLADWLEETLGLAATAALLRAPDLEEVTEEPQDVTAFDHYPLAEDAFLWLVQGHYYPEAREGKAVPWTLIGLYAHPQDRPGDWVKLTGRLVGANGPAAGVAVGRGKTAGNDSRVERARQEVADFVTRTHL